MAKLENNSLRYGMNTQNNVSSIANNAYQQEMANQRDMQNQITHRQDTLLKALSLASAEKTAIRDKLFGVDEKGISRFNPKDAAQVQQLDDEVARSSRDAAYPYLRTEQAIRDSMPTKQFLNEKGELISTTSDRGHSYITAPAAQHPQIIANAKRSGLNLPDYLQQSMPYGSLPLWGIPENN